MNGTPKKQEMETLLNRIDQAYEEVRAISHQLMPPSFANTTFAATLAQFMNDIGEASKIALHFHYPSEKFLNEINKKIQIDMYRILQELLTNIVKHARASEIQVTITDETEQIQMEVKDNGIGFEEHQRKGIGLKTIQSRAEAHHGNFHIQSRNNTGTHARLRLPKSTSIAT